MPLINHIKISNPLSRCCIRLRNRCTWIRIQTCRINIGRIQQDREIYWDGMEGVVSDAIRCDRWLLSAVTDLEGRILNLISKMLSLVRTLSTLYRCCRENGPSKLTEIHLDYDIIKHLNYCFFTSYYRCISWSQDNPVKVLATKG